MGRHQRSPQPSIERIDGETGRGRPHYSRPGGRRYIPAMHLGDCTIIRSRYWHSVAVLGVGTVGIAGDALLGAYAAQIECSAHFARHRAGAKNQGRASAQGSHAIDL